MRLLKVEGTAPMYFQGKKYNLPVTTWLLEGYPRSQPCVFLTPTPDMIIKSNHKHVDASGLVSTPYLKQWSYPASNLRDLTHTLSIHFGQDPPLYSKPPNWKPPPQQHHGASAYGHAASRPPQLQHGGANGSGSGFQGYGNPIVSQAGGHPNQGAAGSGSGAGCTQGPSSASHGQTAVGVGASNSAGPPEDAFKKAALRALSARLSTTFEGLQAHAEKQMQAKLAEQRELEKRSGVLTAAVGRIVQERDRLDESIHKYESKSLELEGWLDKHRDIDKDMDLDSVFVPSDKPTKQALDALSKDMAIEDTMYSLEQALLNDVMDPVAYLKQIRMLSRKQFYLRALCMKIRNVQDGDDVQSIGYGG